MQCDNETIEIEASLTNPCDRNQFRKLQLIHCVDNNLVQIDRIL